MRLLVRPFKACKVCFDIFQQPHKMAPWQWDLVEFCSIECWRVAYPRKAITPNIPVPRPPKPLPSTEPPPLPRRAPTIEVAKVFVERPARKQPQVESKPKKKRRKKKPSVNPMDIGRISNLQQACIRYAEKHGMTAADAKKLWGL